MSLTLVVDDDFTVYTGSPSDTTAGAPGSTTGVPTTPTVGVADSWEDEGGSFASITHPFGGPPQLTLAHTGADHGGFDLLRTDILGNPGQELEVDIVAAGFRQAKVSLVLRRVDTNNKYLCEVTGGGSGQGTVTVYALLDGALLTTGVGTTLFGPTLGDDISIKFSALGVHPTTLRAVITNTTTSTVLVDASAPDSTAPLQTTGLGFALTHYGTATSALINRVRAYALPLSVAPSTLHGGVTTDLTVTHLIADFTPGTPGSPTFSVDHGSFASQSVGSTTVATLHGFVAPPAPQTVTITDPDTGDTATLAIVPATALVATPLVDESGNVLLVPCTDTDGVATPIRSYLPGITLTVDGGTPLSLTDGIYDSLGEYLLFPLNTCYFGDTDDIAGPNFSTTGTWTANSSPPPGFIWRGNACHTSTDPAATAIWAPPDPLAPGIYAFSIPVDHNLGTTVARYTIKDGATTVATHDFDQSVYGPFDGHPYVRMHWSRIGTATITDGTAVTVTVSNPSGTGTLFADAVLFERLTDRASGGATVPAGATVVVTFPDEAVTTDAGTTGPQVRTAILATDPQWYPVPFDPTNVRMAVGKNLNGPAYDASNIIYADRQRSAFGPWSGALKDADSIITGLSAGSSAAISFINSDLTNGFDNWGLLNAAAGDWNYLYNTDGTPDYWLSSIASPPPAFTPSGHYTTPAPGPNQFTFSMSSASGSVYNAEANLNVHSAADCTITNTRLFDPQTPVDWDKMVHPKTYDRLHGKGYSCLRWANALGINTTRSTRWAHYPSGTSLGPGAPPPLNLTATIASVAPVTAPGDLQYFAFDKIRAFFKVTTTAPHGFSSGQIANFAFPGPSPFSPLWPDSDGGDGITSGIALVDTDFSGRSVGIIIVTDPSPTATTFLCVGERTQTPTRGGGSPTTLAGVQTPGGTVSVVGTPCIPPAHIWQICNELGLAPWFQFPHGCIDETGNLTDLVDGVIDDACAHLDPDQFFIAEDSNELWNGYGQFWYSMYMGNYCLANGIPLGGAPNGYGFAGFASGKVVNAARDRWIANGRDQGKFVRLLVSQLGNPGAMLGNAQGAAANGYQFDKISIGAPYMSVAGQVTETLDFGALAAAYARLDLDGLISVWAWRGMSGLLQAAAANIGELMTVDDIYHLGYAALQRTAYEGGPADLCAYGGQVDSYFSVYRRHAATFMPRFYYATLASNQLLQKIGYDEHVRFTHDGVNVLPLGGGISDRLWYDYNSPVDGYGTGDPAENRVPADFPTLVSQMGAAQDHWVGLMTPTPTPTPSRRGHRRGLPSPGALGAGLTPRQLGRP